MLSTGQRPRPQIAAAAVMLISSGTEVESFLERSLPLPTHLPSPLPALGLQTRRCLPFPGLAFLDISASCSQARSKQLVNDR